MKVAWVGIYDRGNIQLERVHFRALFDIDLQFYAILDTQYQSPLPFIQAAPFNQIGVGNRNCFWFAPFKVKAGQNVVLYTRAGAQNTETRTDGSVFHFFFRGLALPIYQPLEKCAVIFEINNWITTPWGS